jgi:O-antigen/teichoic acid export membrane protein
LLIRSGVWVWVVLPLMWMYESFNELETLLTAWLVGVIVATLLGICFIYKEIPVWRQWSIDRVWIFNGFKVGGRFLIATLCFKGLLTLDRYAVEAFTNTELLGVYVFYVGIVMGVMAFLEPAVFSFLYPRLVQARQQGDDIRYKQTMKELRISTIVIGVVLSILSLLATPYIIDWIDKPIYQEHFGVFKILILAGFVYAIGHIPHYGLYARKNDHWIIRAHVFSMSIFVLSLWLLNETPGLYAVAYALLIAFFAMAVIKQMGYNITKNNQSQSTMTSEDCINEPER